MKTFLKSSESMSSKIVCRHSRPVPLIFSPICSMSWIQPLDHVHGALSLAFVTGCTFQRISGMLSATEDTGGFCKTTGPSMPCASHVRKPNNAQVCCVWTDLDCYICTCSCTWKSQSISFADLV